MTTKKYYLTDIASIERAGGKEYHAGTVYMQISASHGQVEVTKEQQKIESKYVIINPKINIYPQYLKIAMEMAMSEFMAKNKSYINIQMDSFKFFEIVIHKDIKEQIAVVNAMRAADKALRHEEKYVETLQKMKKIYLSKMLV